MKRIPELVWSPVAAAAGALAGSSRLQVQLRISGQGDRRDEEVEPSRLLHGYETQLRLYNEAEKTLTSVFLVIQTGEDKAKLEALMKVRESALQRGEKAPEVVVVDARPQISASKA